MREIKFRGICKDTNKWVYGFLWGSIDPQQKETKYRAWYIYTGVNIDIGHKIYEDTAGQFTGLIDKKGEPIFDGDRLKRRVMQDGGDFIDITCDVRWGKWCYCLYIADKYVGCLDTPIANDSDVVGNIYEL
jgi:hypothetical protein